MFRVSESTELYRLRGKGDLLSLLRSFAIQTSVLMLCSLFTAWILWAFGYGERGGMWAVWSDRFRDIEHYDTIFPLLHRAEFFRGAEVFAYPAPSAVVYDLFYLMGGNARLGLLITLLSVGITAAAILFTRALIRRGLRPLQASVFTTALVATSWPLMFLMERANLEVVVTLLVLAGAMLCWRRQPVLASVCWGLAGSMKIYPLILLVLFLRRRHLRSFAAGALTFLSSMILSFWFVGPTIAIAARGTAHGVAGFLTTYASRTRQSELRFDHSYVAALKTLCSLMGKRFDIQFGTTVVLAVLAILGAAMVLYVVRFRSLPLTNQFLILSLVMVSAPPVSYDYTLVNLYPAFALLVLVGLSDEVRGTGLRVLQALLPCFALLLAPENFVFISGVPLNGLIKAVALATATVLLFARPLPELPPYQEELGRLPNKRVRQALTLF